MIARIAVSCAVYAMDKPYSYRIPEGMRIQQGMRVRVPFGAGNRRTEGMVLSVEPGSEERLKPIEAALDEAPVLSAAQLRLAQFLRERYFCTCYDALRAILPSGLWFRKTELLTLTQPGEPPEAVLKKPDACRLFRLLQELGGSAPVELLCAQFPDEDSFLSAAACLQRRKLLKSDLELQKKNAEKYQKAACLAIPSEEAAEIIRARRRAAPQQAAVLSLLLSGQSVSCRELQLLTGACAATIGRLEKLGLICFTWQQVYRRPAQGCAPELQPPPVLNEEQQACFEGLLAQMSREKPGAALLYGVTGSGKTAVYLQLIAKTLENGKSAVLLVPEIALTPQLLTRLRGQFADRTAILHSSLRVGERYDEWQRIRRGEARVVVGTRSAIFAPVQNLGLIILDEEQEHTYKSENAPRYHAREVALYRGLCEQALVLLGSATPSIETMYHAREGKLALYHLTQRYNRQALPKTMIVDMKQELRRGNDTALSLPLEEALRDTILSGHQAVLFLNRRGNSRCLICVECGEAPSCPRCSVQLTYHSANQRLMCHYCGYSEPVVTRCPHCGGALKPVGFGTQKIEQQLAAVFPDTKLIRMDADSVGAADGHAALLGRFQEEKIPILLGTQMIAKGLDFPSVTLAGILDADSGLYLDHYRAAETTFSLITQVAGRSGRGSDAGMAIIQTMTPEHPVLRMAAAQDYDAFYELEIKMRRLRRCPPFEDIFTFTLTGVQEQQVIQSAVRLRDALAGNLQSESFRALDALLLGPAPMNVAKVNYTYRYRLTLCCKNSRPVRSLFSFLLSAFSRDSKNKGVNVFLDVNSYD